MTYERARSELERTCGFEFRGAKVLVRQVATLDRLAELRGDAGAARTTSDGGTEVRTARNALPSDAEVRAAA